MAWSLVKHRDNFTFMVQIVSSVNLEICSIFLPGIHDCIRVWKVEDLKPVAVFDVPYEVSHLNVSLDGSVMGVGHYNGIITTWLLHEVDVVMVNLLQEYVGHTDNILCLCVAPEIDLMCSGSRDRSANIDENICASIIPSLLGCCTVQ
jgi:hypothetical protein